MPSPNVSGGVSDGLSGVAAISANDVWAVGTAGSQHTVGQTLIEQWNGKQWQIVSSPSPSAVYNSLSAVAATSARDAWAVGFQATMTGTTQTLIEHWNGTTWQVAPGANPGAVNNELLSVAAISPRDVWAVGFQTTSSYIDQTLIEHWNGKQWQVTPSANPGASNNHLEGVAAISPRDVWAVGNGVTASGRTLIEHWNGKQWQVTPSPSPNSGGELRAVAAISAKDVWAAGDDVTTTGHALLEHWNGKQWQVAPSPQVGTSPIYLGLAAVAANDVWVVGSATNSDGNFQPLIERWDGAKWHVVASPNPGSSYPQLEGISADSARNVWAVGHTYGTLTEHRVC
ncbi:MAG: hypothetical protein ABI068_00050 [Ktedonobacterales bacterium]